MRNTNQEIRRFHKEEVILGKSEREDIYSKAKTNRSRLRNGLEANGDPEPIGMRTQGSYAMKTMIQDDERDFDIDDGVYFEKEDLAGPQGGEKSAKDARQMVCDAVQDDRFKQAPEVRKNCVRVYYNEGYHVDVPVYRRVTETNLLTGETKKWFELAGTSWRKSDALAVTNWFRDHNWAVCGDATKDGNNGQFVRLVRLLKAFARSRPQWTANMISGIAMSRLAYDHYVEQNDRDDRAFRQMLKRISERLKHNDAIKHPVVDENIVGPGNAKTKYFLEKVDAKLPHLDVLDEADCTHDQAMKAWDKFFGTEWFSNQPDPEEDDELDKQTSGPAVVKRGNVGYA